MRERQREMREREGERERLLGLVHTSFRVLFFWRHRREEREHKQKERDSERCERERFAYTLYTSTVVF